jgi:hypothetical protein
MKCYIRKENKADLLKNNGQKTRETYLLRKDNPKLFCKYCGIIFNGILKKQRAVEDPRFCEDCYKLKFNN